jgi:hypothetical protein
MIAVAVIVVAGIAGVAVASGSLGTSKGPVKPGAGDPSQHQVAITGQVDAQPLTDATPTSSAPQVWVAPTPAPRIAPVKSTAAARPAGSFAALPTSGAPAAASNLGDAQFHNVTFSCPMSPLSFALGQTVVNCTVGSLAGFSGQITTRCSATVDAATLAGVPSMPPQGPQLPMPTNDPGFYSCSVPPVDLPGGGSATIPLTITSMPTAPAFGSGANFYLTLTSGGVTLNPGRPYVVTGLGPVKPANFTLACRVVTQTVLPMPMISAIVGSCTVTALDAADIATTSVHIRGIKPPVPGNQDLHLQLCMAPTQAAAIQSYQSACGSNANVIPTGGTGTVWFGYSMSPLGSTGGMPGPWEFDFAADQGGPSVMGSATFTLQPDGTVAGL